MKIFASPQSWIEGSAVQQLEQTSSLPGMRDVAGMPDLHLGKGCAVGSAALSDGIVYPHLIGNDIGCGYSLFRTNIQNQKVKPSRLAEMISGIDVPWDGYVETFLAQRGVESTHQSVIGTIGQGNHFAELQKVVETDGSVDKTRLVLLVHSGSRSLGESIFQKFAAFCGSKGFSVDSEHFAAYMAAHDNAVKWASANRALIAQRLLECLGTDFEIINDLPHNFVEKHDGGFLHRKGAAPTNRGLSPLPGSRSTPTFLLTPLEDVGNLASLAHGAGRKISRANMRDRVTETTKEMITTPLGGVVICGQDDLLREEHQSAYKAVEQVLKDIETHAMAKSVAKMLPVLTYKSEKMRIDRSSKREKEESWRDERRKRNRR